MKRALIEGMLNILLRRIDDKLYVWTQKSGSTRVTFSVDYNPGEKSWIIEGDEDFINYLHTVTDWKA